MADYFDKDGTPLDMMTWARMHSDDKYRRVDLTLMEKYAISTVWLGLNHNWSDGPPLIFETAVFDRSGDMLDQYMDRYTTLEQAQAGHHHITQMVQELEEMDLTNGHRNDSGLPLRQVRNPTTTGDDAETGR